jgi:hypothetical protein
MLNLQETVQRSRMWELHTDKTRTSTDQRSRVVLSPTVCEFGNEPGCLIKFRDRAVISMESDKTCYLGHLVRYDASKAEGFKAGLNLTRLMNDN